MIYTNKKNYVSVSFAGDKKIIELNKRFRKINLPTNVLSFPSFIQKNDEIFLGDIIFSAETIFREAKRDKKSFNSHLIHLFIHGVLHLIGYDHQNDPYPTGLRRWKRCPRRNCGAWTTRASGTLWKLYRR